MRIDVRIVGEFVVFVQVHGRRALYFASDSRTTSSAFRSPLIISATSSLARADGLSPSAHTEPSAAAAERSLVARSKAMPIILKEVKISN